MLRPDAQALPLTGAFTQKTPSDARQKAFFLARRKHKKPEQKFCSGVVRCKGFEPLTFWFVAKHSIQLS